MGSFDRYTFNDREALFLKITFKGFLIQRLLFLCVFIKYSTINLLVLKFWWERKGFIFKPKY